MKQFEESHEKSKEKSHLQLRRLCPCEAMDKLDQPRGYQATNYHLPLGAIPHPHPFLKHGRGVWLVVEGDSLPGVPRYVQRRDKTASMKALEMVSEEGNIVAPD